MDATASEGFEVGNQREPTGDVLVCGLSAFGLAGLTAVDYFVDQPTLEQVPDEQLPEDRMYM